MTIPRRSSLTMMVAMVAASAVVAAPSLTPLPVSQPVTSHTIELTVMRAEFRPLLREPRSDSFPILAAPIQAAAVQRESVPSLGAAFPAPPIPEPSPVATDFAGAIKSTYSAIEPWVRYGFELATYAVGWVPYVGWLSGQIMIFYNFGERIVRSLVFNSADWLWGPLPFGQGVRNIAQDSWDALVQLGIDEWNFFLPPLPPRPLADQQTTTPPVQVHGSLRASVGPPDLPSRKASDAVAVQALSADGAEPAPSGAEPAPTGTAMPEATNDGSEKLLADAPVGVTSTPDRTHPEAADLQAPNRAVDAEAAREAAPSGTTPAKRVTPRLRSSGDAANAHDSETSLRGRSSAKRDENGSRNTRSNEGQSDVA